MRIVVDADATPGIKLIETVAQKYQVPCILISDDTHDIESNYSEVVTVSKGFQSVDMYLCNHLKEHDIVITQDYGVATIALSHNAFAIHPKGFLYTSENIDNLLNSRHLHMKLRKQGKHVKGPKKRSSQDDERLIKNLEKIILDSL